MYPDDLRYSEEHEWARTEDGRVRVGVTQFAAERLSDVVYVELPPVGTALQFMKPFGTIESVKAVSDLYAPASGTVAEVNAELTARPELVTQEPYGRGWMVVIEPSDLGELDRLMDAAAYRTHLGET